MLPIRSVVDERADKESIAARQMLQEMVGTNLVAFVRRIGQPVRKEEQRLHRRVQVRQPRPLTRCGPSALATEIGSRRHSAISARYFGFSGLFSGMRSRR